MTSSNKIISSTTMLESFGTPEDLKNKLSTLLQTWMMEDLTDFFMEQQLYVDILQNLTPKMALRIFSHTDVSLGVQINFFIKWSEWKKTLDKTATSSKESEVLSEVISLGAILNSNPYGKSVKLVYEKKQELNEDTRKLLLEAILHFCIDNEHSLTVKDSAKLAKQIVETFPNEKMAYYYIHRRNGAPLGKIYQKYRNWKCSLTRKTKNSSHDESMSSLPGEEENIRIIKHEFKNLSFEKVLDHWSKCQNTRLKSIKEICNTNLKTDTRLKSKNKKGSSDKNTIELVLNEWPMYKDPLGYRLIDMDFQHLYGEHNTLLDSVRTFTQVMIDSVLPKYSLKLKEGDKELLTFLTSNKDNADENVILLMVLFLIQSILPLSRIQKPTLRNGNARFYNQAESRNCFISIHSTEAEYNESNEKRKKTTKTAYPHISVIGTIYEPTAIFFDLNAIRYKLFTLCKTIDICFKAYFLFNIAFPEECSKMWDFLNLKFYKLPRENDNAVAPGVHMLVKNVEDCMESSSLETLMDMCDN